MNLYCVTESDQTDSRLHRTQLVIAETDTDAARLFTLDKRYQRNDLEIIHEAKNTLLFVTPAPAPLDKPGIVDWSPHDAQFVPFDREWLKEDQG